MTSLDLPRLAGLIFGAPLMIARPKLDVILDVVTPRLLAGGPMDPVPTDPGDRPYQVTGNGIALIPVLGTLTNRTFGLAAMSGLASYASLGTQLDQAELDPQVQGILLDVDSNGGQAGGVFDLADRITTLRGVKPVYAIASEACLSAAYALACGAERLFVTQTGAVGSVGVVAVHVDQSGADQKAGLNYDYVTAGEHKADANPHAPLSDDARASLQAEVDRLYGLFVGLVARNRGLSADVIRSQQAGVFFGPNAVAAGLADQVGTFDSALAALRERVAVPPRSLVTPSVTPSRTGGTMSDTVTPVAQSPETPPPVATEAALREQLAAEYAALAEARPPTAETPAQLEARLRAEASEIFELCQIAGKLDLAGGYVRQGMSPAAVRKTLLNGAAASFEATATQPVETGVPQGDNPLIAAIKAAYPTARKGA